MNKKQGVFILFIFSSMTMLFTLIMMSNYNVSFWNAIVCTLVSYVAFIVIAAFLIGLFRFGTVLDMLEDEG